LIRPTKASIYKKLLSDKRRRKTTGPKGRTLALQAASDRGRVLFSASFRRLQSKTQAFPQEWNAAVRTRLTHSLEVASVGRYAAEGIAQTLLKEGHLGGSRDPNTHNLASAVVTFVEVACLMHDLGNPPFGHFGEATIREWFANRESHFREQYQDTSLFDERYKDFSHFDGNPQGFRMATRLQWVNDEFGYNLTLTQLAATLKYPWTPEKIGEIKNGEVIKKAGVFCSEAEILVELQNGLKLHPEARHPLTYVMEAADDISYCLSDIEDALEKHVVRNDDVIRALRGALSSVTSAQAREMLRAIPELGTTGEDTAWFVRFRTTVTNELVKRACELYSKHHDAILRGDYFQLLKRSKAAHALLNVVRTFSQEKLYTSRVVRERELVGFQVVSGILEKFSLLLDLTTYDAVQLLCEDVPSPVNGATLACTLRSLLPKKHLKVYQHEIQMLKASQRPREQLDVLEWMARAHLVVDYLSGMTDDFSIVMYRRLFGGGAHQL
jgi:dGTPase